MHASQWNASAATLYLLSTHLCVEVPILFGFGKERYTFDLQEVLGVVDKQATSAAHNSLTKRLLHRRASEEENSPSNSFKTASFKAASYKATTPRNTVSTPRSAEAEAGTDSEPVMIVQMKGASLALAVPFADFMQVRTRAAFRRSHYYRCRRASLGGTRAARSRATTMHCCGELRWPPV